MMKLFAKTILFLLVPALLYAQKNNDSLRNALNIATTDSARYHILSNLAQNYSEVNWDSALHYTEQSLLLTTKHQIKYAEASDLNYKGYILMKLGKHGESLRCLQQALKFAEDPAIEKDTRWNTDKNITAHKLRLDLLMNTHHSLGHLMQSAGMPDQTILHYNKTKSLAEENGDTVLLGFVNMNLGNTYKIINKLDSAQLMEEEAARIFNQTGNKKYLSVVFAYLGKIHLEKKNKALALQNFHLAIQSAIEQNMFASLSMCYNLITNYYLTDEPNKDSCLHYAKMTLATLQLIGSKDLGEAYDNLYRSYKVNNITDSAYKYQGLALTTIDSSYQARIKSLSELQSLSFNEQLRVQELEKEKELTKSRTRTYALLAGLVVFLLTAIFLYRNNRSRKKTNDRLKAQKRELEIGAALEKVRSRSLAMYTSEELREVVTVAFDSLRELGFNMNDGALIILEFIEGTKDNIQWIKDPEHSYAHPFRVPYSDHMMAVDMLNAHQNNVAYFSKLYAKEEKDNYFRFLFEQNEYKNLPEKVKNLILDTEHYGISVALAGNSGILMATNIGKLLSEAEATILQQLVKVFDQAYTRFQDLQKAESQTREAEIQLALERVRARSMAMHSSEELNETATLLFEQLNQLGAALWGVAFGICEPGNALVKKWTSGGKFFIPYTIDPSEKLMYDVWAQQIPLHKEIYNREEIISIHEKLIEVPEFKASHNGRINQGFTLPDFGINYIASFKYGYLLILATQHFNEEQIFIRFAKVFEQTYTRFLDLQKAEALTLETIKRTSIDRVRAEIASMRTTSDLERITPLIWNELNTLSVPFIRCGVLIMDEKQEQVNTFLSAPDGKAISAFQQPYHTPGETAAIINCWHKKELYKQHWDEAKFSEFTDNLMREGDLYVHFLPFLQGMLYVGNTSALQDNELQLVQNLADAFSTAYARYEDFNKLEAAKEQVDKTLTDLKQTQAQLVQAEKMASLGELTAGIAHEIQNPLNFVNNFSEINAELTKEIVEAAQIGNMAEIIQLAADIHNNQDKISEHGKRADAIVKGMLQHSRSSSGVKEPTDINKLAEEYFRLAYHGLRANDKSFNAKLHTDFDPAIGMVPLMPQDIGRVLLNLYNNAFYAVSEKTKLSIEGYEPLVTVRTEKINGVLEIRVADNGNGIPEKVLEKVFQPFFTTKPTGKGTGLGLSLSYDIIKAHLGKITIKNNPGTGAEFIVTLPIHS